MEELTGIIGDKIGRAKNFPFHLQKSISLSKKKEQEKADMTNEKHNITKRKTDKITGENFSNQVIHGPQLNAYNMPT